MAKTEIENPAPTSFKAVAEKQANPSPPDVDELAKKIILAISHELHVRVGIGPIWRQLNAARKKEIIDAWTHKTVEILSE